MRPAHLVERLLCRAFVRREQPGEMVNLCQEFLLDRWRAVRANAVRTAAFGVMPASGPSAWPLMTGAPKC